MKDISQKHIDAMICTRCKSVNQYEHKIKLCDPQFYFYFPSSLEDIIIRYQRIVDRKFMVPPDNQRGRDFR